MQRTGFQPCLLQIHGTKSVTAFSGWSKQFFQPLTELAHYAGVFWKMHPSWAHTGFPSRNSCSIIFVHAAVFNVFFFLLLSVSFAGFYFYPTLSGFFRSCPFYRIPYNPSGFIPNLQTGRWHAYYSNFSPILISVVVHNFDLRPPLTPALAHWRRLYAWNICFNTFLL